MTNRTCALPTAVEPSPLTALLDEVRQRPTYAAYLRASREIERLVSASPEGSQTRIRMAVLSSYTIEPLVAALRVDAYQGGLTLDCHVTSYGRIFEEALKPGSNLYTLKPEVIVVLLDVDALLPRAEHGVSSFAVETVLMRVRQLIEALKRQTNASLLLSNFPALDLLPYAVVPDALDRAYQELNRSLRTAYTDDPQVVLIDLDGLVAYHGRVRSVDPKLRYLAGMPMSESFLPLVSRKILAVIRAFHGLARKCLVLDLDNTLWGGILGEVGSEGIALGPETAGRSYVDVQKIILRLRERGVLLAINSKNNLNEVLQVLREHPHMVLREEHFSSIQVGWTPKPERMQRIAQELHVGLDSLAFLDDDPAERLQMSMVLPEVLTVEMPDNPAAVPSMLLELPVFEKPAMTEEDRARDKFFATERQREAVREHAKSFEEFLQGLGMCVTVRLAQAGDVTRVAQLTQKTNQFNVTTRRYHAGEIAAMLQDASVRIYTLRLRDAFGDSGLTGVAMVRVEGTSWCLDTLLMSCRIIGRRIETVFLNEVIADAIQAGAARLWGEYLPTHKNGVVKDFYANEGFTTQDGRVWSLALRGVARPQPPWIQVER